jgi:hypothetical protein
MSKVLHISGIFLCLVCALVGGLACSPCNDLNSAFMDFVEANKSCQKDSDCMVVGGNGSCNCTPSLGSCYGNAISRSADRTQLDAFYRVFESCQDEMGGYCDCGSATGSECVSGRCRISGVNECLSWGEDRGYWPDDGPDGGSDGEADGGEED